MLASFNSTSIWLLYEWYWWSWTFEPLLFSYTSLDLRSTHWRPPTRLKLPLSYWATSNSGIIKESLDLPAGDCLGVFSSGLYRETLEIWVSATVISGRPTCCWRGTSSLPSTLRPPQQVSSPWSICQWSGHFYPLKLSLNLAFLCIAFHKNPKLNPLMR